MRARLPSCPVLLLLVVLVASGCRGGDPAPEPTPSPSTSPTPDPARPEPFALAIEHIAMAPMGNEEIVGAPAGPVDASTAEQAVAATGAALERYLNAQFVTRASRFGADPARALLKPGLFDTLLPAQREALGVLDLPVTGVVTGPATGTASVLFEGEHAYAVTIEFEARLRVRFDDDGPDHPVVQRGTVLFTAPTWGVESMELALDAPPPPPPPPPSESESGSPSAATPSGSATEEASS